MLSALYELSHLIITSVLNGTLRKFNKLLKSYTKTSRGCHDLNTDGLTLVHAPHFYCQAEFYRPSTINRLSPELNAAGLPNVPKRCPPLDLGIFGRLVGWVHQDFCSISLRGSQFTPSGVLPYQPQKAGRWMHDCYHCFSS